jgi:hypothetical protein
LEDVRIAYTLFRHPRRTRLAVQVTGSGEVVLRVLMDTTVGDAEQFLCRHGGWVMGQLRRVRVRPPQRPALVLGTPLPLLDEQLTLRPGYPPMGRVRRVGDELWVPRSAMERLSLEALLERWYRRQAQRLLPLRLQTWASRIGVTVGRVTIRSQKTRWGSCSSRGDISLNWQIVLLSPPLADYVLIHELCHRRHMDHSPAYWAFVAQFDPLHRQHRQMLKSFTSPF